MGDTNRKRVIAMTIGSFMAFFIMGFIDVLKGSTLSAVLEETGYTYSRGGVIVMAAYFGFLAGTLTTGIVSDAIGRKPVLIIAAAFFLAGLGGYAASGDLAMFIVSFFLIGFGCGSVELGANHIVIEVQSRNPGRYLNLLATFFGAGSMVAPIYAGQMFKAHFTWREIYQFTMAAPLVLFVYFLVAKYPAVQADKSENLKLGAVLKKAFTGEMVLLYILVFAYVGAEVAIGTWLVEYLKVIANTPVDSGNNWLSAYFACIMSGRFAGSFVVERIGYVRIMIIAVILSIACVVLGVYGPDGFVCLLPLTGIFYSIIFPTATAFVSRLIKTNVGAILGLFFCFVGAGGMAGPWIQGIVNDRLGLRIGMTTAAWFSVVMLVCLVCIALAEKRRLDRRKMEMP